MAKQRKLAGQFNEIKESTKNFFSNVGNRFNKHKHSGIIQGTDIKLAPKQRVEHHNYQGLSTNGTFYSALMDNGHTVLASIDYPEYSLEVMPGAYKASHNFINDTNHWRMYYVEGSGIDIYSAPIPDNYSYLQEMPRNEADKFPRIPGDKYGNRWAIGYNKDKRILLVSAKALSLDNH